MSLQRLVLFVEGKGDVQAIPLLAKRLIQLHDGFNALILDSDPYRVGNLGALVKDDCKNWRRWLGAAAKKQPFAGVLLVLDGDIEKVPPTWKRYIDRFGLMFCPYHAAAVLGDVAREHGAGIGFSVATLFAMKEFECWVIAGIEGIRGAELAGSRGKVPDTVQVPSNPKLDDVRDAKGLLREQVPLYKESLDQAVLARRLDIRLAAQRSRSFQHMHSAIGRLIDAVRSKQTLVSPPMPNRSG